MILKKSLWIICLVAVCQARAAETECTGCKTNPSKTIGLINLVGFSGLVQTSTATAVRRITTAGYLGSKIIASNGRADEGRIQLYPGLWGGGPAMLSPLLTSTHTFSSVPRASLVIPAGALERFFFPRTSASPLSNPIHVSPSVIRAALDNLSRSGSAFTAPVAERLYEIHVVDELDRVQDGLLRKPALLTLPFDTGPDGMVAGTDPPVRVESLSIWWLDEQNSLWVKIPGGTIDTSSKTVTAPILHFSVYTVMGAPTFNPAEVRAFPVPWRPTGPNAGSLAGQTGTSTGITFTNLPSLATIKIYTLTGAIVKEIAHTTGLPQTVWNGKSDDGQDVTTGTYIYVVDGDGAKKSGKLVIIR